jgi:AAA domain
MSGLRFTPLEEFAAVDEPGAESLASSTDGEAALAAGSDILVYGDGGAGKTTLVLDVCFKLAAGASWLGLVTPERPLRIAIVENEGPRPMLRRKLDRKLAGASLGGRIVVLEDPWGELTFADATHRSAIALAATELDLDLLVVGPLISAGQFPLGGTPTEVAAFETHTKALRALLDRPLAILLVHHENQAGRVSGAWGRFGDTHMHITALGNGKTRLHWAKARWASSLHKTTSQLLWADGESFVVEDKPEITADTIRDSIIAAVSLEPGASWTKIRDLHGKDGERLIRGGAEDVKSVRDELIADGVIVNQPARKDGFNLWPADDPELNRSDLRTAPERLPFTPPASEANTEPFAVRSYIANGTNGNGLDEPEIGTGDAPPWTDAEAADVLDALEERP